ncbi:MAG: hypothetical protein CMI01_04985 [Oceanospirillaceae bacterium]|uniref:RSP_7527 family protein n=1 Tax=Marinobacterium litorale TaxID=404770 RepID=UPI00041ED953|nr:hypothetical protein [Marinobacterium litorale]MBS98012.1 hypothetical protein [Oceanospirillaceae bacterium]
MSTERFELKYTTDNVIDVDYYIEQARADRAAFVAEFFRKTFFRKSEKSGKARVSYSMQQSPAH